MNPEKPAPEPSAEYAEAGMFAFRLDRSMHEDPYRKTIKLILDRDKDILAAKQAELDAVKAQNLALRDAVLGNGTFVCEIDPVQYAKETRECLAQARAALAECQKDRERLDWLGTNWGHKINAVGKHYTRQEFINSRAGKGVVADFRQAIDEAKAGGEK